MKILITGSEGQLGRDLVRVLSDEHELFPFDLDMDVTVLDGTMKTVTTISPDVVIHAAAYTDVDGCELNPDLAYKVNALGTQNVALTCQRCGAAMLYVSTDFVFDGKKGEPYLEFDEPNPISVYGRSKLAGERYVTSLLDRYYITRTAWLFGKHGRNFVKTILKLAEEREELTVVDDQMGSPTYSLDLAKTIAELVKTGWYGLYHTTNSGSCSWFEFAKKILECAGKRGVKVSPITSEELNRPAPRPTYSVLKNYCLELRGIQPLRHYEEALRDYFS
ncbi:MAG: dTDP-4-dehydrorhamnose reductase [Actinomycetota bacterium]|nr:dTDP-4-dehydrorhamnose reductase [Actinomycetota bacterium]